MNRKLLILFSALAVGIGIILFAGHDSFDTETITIHAPIFEVAPQFTQLRHWPRWNTALAGRDSLFHAVAPGTTTQYLRLSEREYYELQVLNAADARVHYELNGISRTAEITATASTDGKGTLVTWSENVAPLRWIKRKITGEQTRFPALAELKSLLEDDSRRYGFPIRIVPVTDTLILTTKKNVTADQANATIASLYRQLRDELQRLQLKPKGDYYYITSFPTDKHQLEVAVGIPLTKPTPVSGDFLMLKLPGKGHMIAGYYSGRYDQRQEIFSAMEKYIMDKHFKKVAQPLARYRQDQDLSDSAQLTMTLFYPVY